MEACGGTRLLSRAAEAHGARSCACGQGLFTRSVLLTTLQRALLPFRSGAPHPSLCHCPAHRSLPSDPTGEAGLAQLLFCQSWHPGVGSSPGPGGRLWDAQGGPPNGQHPVGSQPWVGPPLLAHACRVPSGCFPSPPAQAHLCAEGWPHRGAAGQALPGSWGLRGPGWWCDCMAQRPVDRQ